MDNFNTVVKSRLAMFIGGAALALLVTLPFMGTAQDKTDKTKDPDHIKHKDKQPVGEQNLASQIAELNTKVAKLEAALAKSQAGMPGMGSMDGKKPAMGMDDDKMMGGMAAKKKGMAMGMMEGMEMMDMKSMGGMGMMDMKSMGGMEMMDMEMMEMMGMMGMAPKSASGMAGMKSMGKMQMKAALPSFPGASHIYHIGATDFFLNHPEHLTLTAKQKADLGRLKEKTVLAKTSAQRKIDEGEQELWILTSADEPDAAKIEAKIRDIEKLRGDQRMVLIRAVGDAAKLLTDEQRQALLGTGVDKMPKSDADKDKPDPHAGHKKP